MRTMQFSSQGMLPSSTECALSLISTAIQNLSEREGGGSHPIEVGENDSVAAQSSAVPDAIQPALELGSVQDRRRGGARRLELLPRNGSDSVKFSAELISYATIVRGQPRAFVRGGVDDRGGAGCERGLGVVQLFLQ